MHARAHAGPPVEGGTPVKAGDVGAADSGGMVDGCPLGDDQPDIMSRTSSVVGRDIGSGYAMR